MRFVYAKDLSMIHTPDDIPVPSLKLGTGYCGNGNVTVGTGIPSGGLRVGNESVGVGIPVSRVPLPLTGGEGGEPGWGGCRGWRFSLFNALVLLLSFVRIDSNDGILTPCFCSH